MIKYFSLIFLIVFIYPKNQNFDFVSNEELSDNYILIVDNRGFGKWNLKINIIGNKDKAIVASNDETEYDKLAGADKGLDPMYSSDNNSPLKAQPGSNFTIKADLQSIQSLGEITEIKLFLEEKLPPNQNNYYYNFNGDCQLNNTKEAICNIDFSSKKDGNFLIIKDIVLKEEFQVDASCFDSQPRINATDYQINFINKTNNPTNIYIFADCGTGIYDFSDYPVHGGRKIKLNPNQKYTFRIKNGGWKNLKYRFSNNLTSMEEGTYQPINIKKLTKSKTKSINININNELVKEVFGSKETFDIAADFGASKTQKISYILDRNVRNPKKGDEFAIINNKVVFPTANINKIRHLSINGIPAVIDETNKKIKKATDPILVIVDLNYVDPNKKQEEDFQNTIKEIYKKTENSNIHLYKYLNQYPDKNSRNHIFESSVYDSNLGLTGIYMLNFDKAAPERINPSDTFLTIHDEFPYIDDSNWDSFQNYIDGVDVIKARIDKFAVWSFEPILSIESLNRIGNTNVGENMAMGNYIRTFRNTVLNTDQGHNNILPSSSESNYKKIYYLSYNEPTSKTRKEAAKFNKQYEIIFKKFTDYNQIFK